MPCQGRPAWSIIVFLLLLNAHLQGQARSTAARPCAARIYPGLNQGLVCVCNSTYCDDVPELGDLIDDDLVVIYRSSHSGKRFERTTAMWTIGTGAAGTIPIRVNASQLKQTIIGFGGAFTDAAGINLNALSAETRMNLLNSYFADNGLQYSLGRVPMASCDFSTREYSYDDYDQDFQLLNFSLTDEDRQLKIPYIKEAQRLTGGDLKLFASPWSAPGWMKTNGHMRGGGMLKGPPGGPYHTTWANYFVKFLEAYSIGYNITYWGMTAQNEPNTGRIVDYSWQTMYFNATMQRDFIANSLGPILKRSIYGQRVALMVMDDQRSFLPDWADTVFADNQANFYTAGIALHWYLDFDNVWSPSILTHTHERHPTKFILGTEACTGELPGDTKPNLGDWLRGDEYAHDIMMDLNHWVAGWTDWNLALDLQGGPNWVGNFVDAAIIVNSTADEFYKNPMFYVMGHFSKFIRPGSQLIGLSITVDSVHSLEGSAFLTSSNQKLLVIINRHVASAYQLVIQDASKPGKVLNINLEPQTIATIIWK